MIESLPLPPITSSLAEAQRHVLEFGVARLSGVLSESQIAAARRRVEAQARAEKELGCAVQDGAPDPKEQKSGPNQRIRNLINKGEIFRDIAVTPAVLSYARFLLGRHILLSSYSANIACQGGVPMGLHQDQGYIGSVTLPMATAVVWMLVDFTEENGATLVAPGSHRWKNMSPASPEVLAAKTVPATGPAGTVLLMDGRTFHGTGANRTGDPRYGLITYFTKPFIRQEENFSLSLSPEVMKQCSRELLALLGFEVWFRLGGIDGSDHGSIVTARPTSFSCELQPQQAPQ